ncbi:MAG TPA: hypothetical protein VMB18_04555 [Terriglobales bacterium]|nr:hypothetical protein [Terriglobales bacterium]
MSIVMKLMVSGWILEGALVALCALNQSGELIKLHERIGQWLKASGPRSVGAPDH